MSDAVRSYRSGARNSSVKSRSLLGGSLRLTRYLLLAVIVLVIVSFWVSRDTHEIEEFVSGGATFQVVAQNLVESRSRIQKSKAWNAVPEMWRVHPLPDLLQTPISLPEWVQRNLVGRYVFMSGTDLEGFSDTVYITKLSRVGSLLERLLRLNDGNIGDATGGLDLRHLSEYDVYYAIRGRVALLSSSRRALIHSLTLDESERVPSEDWDETIWLLGDEDLRGTFALDKASIWSDYFSGAGFALRLDENEAFLKLSLPCTDVFYDDFGEGLRGASAQNLLVPLDGPIQLSAHLNGNAEGLWKSIAAVINSQEEFFYLWDDWRAETEPESLASYLAQTLGDVGPGIAFTWHGFEMNAIVPTAEFSLIAEVQTDSLAKRVAELAGPETSRNLAPVRLLLNSEANWIEAVDVGGSARTAVIMPFYNGRRVFASTSKVLAETIWKGESGDSAHLSERANLFFSVSPGEAVTRYAAYGRALAADGLLAQFNAEEFEARIRELTAKYSEIDQIEVIAQHEDGIVMADIVLRSTTR